MEVVSRMRRKDGRKGVRPMTDKEKIAEILKAYTKKHGIMASSVILDEYAEELVANGVIVPPCKVGDAVWYELYGKIESAVVYSCVGVLKKQGVEITDANAKRSCGLEVAFNGKCIGKTVFLTKEEAEKALKESEQNDR